MEEVREDMAHVEAESEEEVRKCGRKNLGTL